MPPQSMWMGSAPWLSLPARPLPRWRLLLWMAAEKAKVLMSWAYDTVPYYRVSYPWKMPAAGPVPEAAELCVVMTSRNRPMSFANHSSREECEVGHRTKVETNPNPTRSVRPVQIIEPLCHHRRAMQAFPSAYKFQGSMASRQVHFPLGARCGSRPPSRQWNISMPSNPRAKSGSWRCPFDKLEIYVMRVWVSPDMYTTEDQWSVSKALGRSSKKRIQIVNDQHLADSAIFIFCSAQKPHDDPAV
ncbi:hypothetical protein B0T09DRAFT_370297 [Sordaria sp. MPI-SDFR-AT-0083]|nr:hypothetical protein B0T09DRAFT_370297 [Sordaria sp. MPI-SDFR-AT-0083]